MLMAMIKQSVQKALMSRGFVLTMTMRYLRRKRGISLPKYAGDYVRNSSLELVAHEISSKKITGNVAELGVYRGDFARIVNELFPDRKLYLFDTFEGFDRHDAAADKAKAYSAGNQDFSRTSIETILKKMPHPGTCVIKKGRFPESAAGLEDSFAFVSIDADLYAPIYDGLRFFYPRLSRGGYIFVHDFNNDEYKGAREAVLRFCGENNIPYVPMTDTCGTAVLSK
jgi:O-methyltransferase